ncbi:hypothetical protein [Sporosarcina sp. P33]|uniref:hypothetical protein n=1 Tax=Sporosarcina sp. P33 TaxID=1930764 RepID=UPI0009C01FE2|nr:hypothetical protein [Sporosarcina sp. P33]ARD48910.1 hypothetical protein SporoP33_12180 [Sporosarcina sp. P33]
MKQLWKAALALMLLVSVLGAGLKADAAAKPGTPAPVEKKPYEYEFIVDEDAKYNGFSGAKEMVITFDKKVNDMGTANVRVEQITTGGNIELPIVESVNKGIAPNENILTIKFKNLEFVDHINKQDLQLVIKQGSLYFDQITDYVLPFKFYDLTPGFNSVFLNVDNATKINTNIFKYNEPRNVMIQVPPVYMTKIETIHRYIEAVGPGDAASKKSPNLSNIDVIADPAAARLKVKLGTGTDTKHSRDLDRSTAGVNGFSLGQAGIETIVCKDPSAKENDCDEYNNQNDQIQLTAYSKDGRKLETRSFKMRVNDSQKDFKINDYIKANPKLYGKPVSLYDFMASPALLNSIMEETTLSKLNDFGVVYSVGNLATVENREQFDMAIKNTRLKKIELGNTVLESTVQRPVKIARDVTITGGIINGDVELISGEGEKSTAIRLNDMRINGKLTVNVGKEGTAILDKVTVGTEDEKSLTIFESGGINSIHLNEFISHGGVSIENITPLRIVTTNTINTMPLHFLYNAKSAVNLEVVSGSIDLTNNVGELKQENAFTVFIKDKDNVRVDEKFTGEYFTINEVKVAEDEMTNVTVATLSDNIPKLTINDSINLPLTDIIKLIQEDSIVKVLNEKTITWNVKGKAAHWAVSIEGQNLNIKGVTDADLGENNSIILEATDGVTRYQINLKVGIEP